MLGWQKLHTKKYTFWKFMMRLTILLQLPQFQNTRVHCGNLVTVSKYKVVTTLSFLYGMAKHFSKKYGNKG